MYQNELLKPIDEAETIKNVKNFFEVTIPRICRIAHISVGSLQSPQITDIPHGESNNHSLEDQIVKSIDYKQELLDVMDAVAYCSKFCRKIILDKYIQDEIVSDNYLISDLPFSETQFFKYKKQAYLEFADAYQQICDLHTYKESIKKV